IEQVLHSRVGQSQRISGLPASKRAGRRTKNRFRSGRVEVCLPIGTISAKVREEFLHQCPDPWWMQTKLLLCHGYGIQMPDFDGLQDNLTRAERNVALEDVLHKVDDRLVCSFG